jgi:hypothetical protein
MKKTHTLSWQVQGLILFGLLASAYVVFTFFRGIYLVVLSTGLPSPMATHVSEQFHISIDYPRTWAAGDLPDGNHGDHEAIAYIGYAGLAASPSIIVARRSFVQPLLDDVAKWGESRLMVLASHGETLNFGSLSSPNDTAILRYYNRAFYNRPFGFVNRKCMDWYTIEGSTGYDLSFCVSDKYWAEMESTFLQMAQSFRAY